MPRAANIFGKAALSGCVAAVVLASPASLSAQTTDLLPVAPVDHFKVYGFDKNNGWRNWELEGARAVIGADGSVKVIDMKLRIFEASEKQVVNMTIESPLAGMPTTRDRIEGPDKLLMTAKGILLSGEDWCWRQDEHKLTIKRRTHTVVEGEVGPVLE